MQIRDDHAGFSLISVMIAIGIIGIMSQIMMQYTSNTMRAAQLHQIHSDYEIVRQTLRRRVDCMQTVNPRPVAACDDMTASTVDVRDESGNVIISKNVLEPVNWLGAYHLRAVCLPHPVGHPTERAIYISIRATKGLGDPQPLLHPLHPSQEMEWTQLFNVPVCMVL